MLAHLVPLLRRERPTLPQHLVADADLADVVQQRPLLDDGELWFANSDLLREATRVTRDSPGMPLRIGVAAVERGDEPSEQALGALLYRVLEPGLHLDQAAVPVSQLGQPLVVLAPRRALGGSCDGIDELVLSPWLPHDAVDV